MNLNGYQQAAARTDRPADNGLTIAALGLCGESGEFADIVKKALAQGHELDRDDLIAELGDVLWYIAKAARELDVSLDDVAERNLRKLWQRYPDGFDADRSRNR